MQMCKVLAGGFHLMLLIKTSSYSVHVLLGVGFLTRSELREVAFTHTVFFLISLPVYRCLL